MNETPEVSHKMDCLAASLAVGLSSVVIHKSTASRRETAFGRDPLSRVDLSYARPIRTHMVKVLGDSLREYARRVGRRGWAVVVSGIGAVLGLISLVVPPPAGPNPQPLVPTWLWLVLFLGGIALAQFLAFHDVRLQRDASRADASLRLDSVRYRFVLEALDGHAALGSKAGEEPRPGYQFVLTFANAGLEPMYYKVESMTISMGGFTADPAEVFSSDDGIILPGAACCFTTTGSRRRWT
jgi:hypothetical protein